MGTRQDQADDTRRRLFAAAVELFSSLGYHGTTVDAIAKRAGVAKGTFFVHFATKDAVIVELVRRQTQAARAARLAALPAGPIAALRATTLALGEQAGLSRELSRAVLAAALDNATTAGDADAMFGLVLVDMIEDARRARAELRTGVGPEQLARGLLATYLGAAFHFTSNRRSAALTVLLEPVVDAFLEGALEKTHAKPRASVRRPRVPRRVRHVGIPERPARRARS
ncbi:MAG: TetR/AcrR family transcriptional regulator [Deltaproteobacteria bacterium]|nr:TetR/AcrR family transcriptional regulator [Deltaproteobacteria bacterium]MDQ3298380.1 TetR/AcrR family transcriptional regulator [Myxococcota bacterium]